MKQAESEEIELDLLLDAVRRRYGYDFRHYSRASLKRRIQLHVSRSDLSRVSDLIGAVLSDESCFEKLLFDLSVTVTEMFRDPEFFRALRERVVSILETYPYIRIWHAGCATGEEVYSMAILLQEEDLYDRARIYATDVNARALAAAKDGVYPASSMREYTANYNGSGGKSSFSDYYHARYDRVKVDEGLKRNVTFAQHNLVTDGVFGEMQLIVCRNVLIYFDRELQSRVLGLFRDSLCHGGFLGLGPEETVRFSSVEEAFERICDENLYRCLWDH